MSSSTSSKKSKSLLSSPVSDIIEKAPFERNFFQSIFPDYDHKEWLPLVKKMKTHYKKFERGNKLYLPKGTKLSMDQQYLLDAPDKKNNLFWIRY